MRLNYGHLIIRPNIKDEPRSSRAKTELRAQRTRPKKDRRRALALAVG
jgi:hypothetical protein